MDDALFIRMLKLSNEGFRCAQILMILAIESEGVEDGAGEGLIRAVGGLNVGLADMLGPCGALTGACCLISYFAGKGASDELEDPALSEMVSGFAAWFGSEFGRADGETSGKQDGKADDKPGGKADGGITCTAILDGDIRNMRARCPDIVRGSYLKAMEILEENGVI